jgi:hypothetical protein
MVKQQADVEAGDQKSPLLEDKNDSVKEAVAAVPHTDVKDAAFWLFMLFLASVTMTVGNKVCYYCCDSSVFIAWWWW